MPYEIKVTLESADEKSRVELEARRAGVPVAHFFRLLFKSYMGEIKIERTSDGGEPNNKKD